MGAWGEGMRENDDAGDAIAYLPKGRLDSEQVADEEALRRVEDLQRQYGRMLGD